MVQDAQTVMDLDVLKPHFSVTCLLLDWQVVVLERVREAVRVEIVLVDVDIANDHQSERSVILLPIADNDVFHGNKVGQRSL